MPRRASRRPATRATWPSHTTWSQTTFNHAGIFTAGRRPRDLQPCSACHRDDVYRGTPHDCVGCHQADYQRTTSPNHRRRASRPPATPAIARRTRASGRDASTTTPSSAGGRARHAGLHGLPQEQRLQGHAARLRRLPPGRLPADDEPEPPAAGFPTTCDSCHRPTDPSFKGGRLQPHSRLPAGRRARHAGLRACHKNNVYKGTPRDCVGCHLADYQRTTSPNHAAAGFPTTCDSCHRATDSQFRARLQSQLASSRWWACTPRRRARRATRTTSTRARRATASAATSPTTSSTTNPNHQAAGFPTTCDSCHQPTDATLAPGACSTTRGSRSRPDATRAGPAPTATPIRTTTRCSAASRCHSLSSIQGEHRAIAGFRYDSTPATAATRPVGGRGGLENSSARRPGRRAMTAGQRTAVEGAVTPRTGHGEIQKSFTLALVAAVSSLVQAGAAAQAPGLWGRVSFTAVGAPPRTRASSGPSRS